MIGAHDALRWMWRAGLVALLASGVWLWSIRGAAILLDLQNFFCL
jgi:hypothetical protein